MQKINHKRKLTKQEKRLDEEAKQFELILFSDKELFPDTPPDQRETPSPSPKKQPRKYTRLNRSPITIPGTPDNARPPQNTRHTKSTTNNHLYQRDYC